MEGRASQVAWADEVGASQLQIESQPIRQKKSVKHRGTEHLNFF